MADTPKLSLPELSVSQSSKETTHNESLWTLDALVQATVIDKDLTAPPGSLASGDCYLVGASATGDWAGYDNYIAQYKVSAWVFYEPQNGWKVYVSDEGLLYVYTTAGGWETGSDHNHDDRYYTESELSTPSTGDLVDWTNIANKPSIGSGDGDVVGPATNTDEYVPQWDGADSKTLKDGFPISAAGKALIDDADAAAQRATLGVDAVAIGSFYPSVLTDAGLILVYNVVATAFTVAAACTGSIATAQTAATAETIISLKKNGTEFGTVTFAAAGTTGTFAATSATSFAIGDVLSIVGPATADTTLAGVAISLKGVKA